MSDKKVERDEFGRPIVTLLRPYRFLLEEKARYKVIYGGRGGGKSNSIARAILMRGYNEKIIVVAAREKKSELPELHQLFEKLIYDYELQDFYTVHAFDHVPAIRGANGTYIKYVGLGRSYRSIKSTEGINILWVEEADKISKKAWDYACPTVRESDNCELWISFNPDVDTDETYLRFIVCPRRHSIVKKINYNNIPEWCIDSRLRDEINELKKNDYSEYLTIYEGVPRTIVEGSIYSDELQKCIEENRIQSFQMVKDVPCFSAWDIGYSDMTSIWSWQVVGGEIRILDFYQNRLKPLNHYLDYLRKNGINYAMHYLPWDSNHEQLAAQGKSIFNQVRELGVACEILPKLSIKSGITYCRSIFDRVFFNAERCMRGIECLKHYRFKVDYLGKFSEKPVHDKYSHGADAFRHMAIAIGDESLDREENSRRFMKRMVG